MKNTLAENMLRFGVKNLSESDIKKIEESVLNEVFKDANLYPWPHFNNQQQVDAFRDIALTPLQGNGPIWQAIFGQGSPNAKVDEPTVLTNLGAAGPSSFAGVFWFAQALNPNSQGFAIPNSMEQAAAMMRRGKTALKNWNTNFNSQNLPVDQVQTAVDGRIKWWDELIEFPIGSGKRTQTRWQLFSSTYLRPTLPKLQPLFVKATAPAAAAPGMTPGVKPVPGKQ